MLVPYAPCDAEAKSWMARRREEAAHGPGEQALEGREKQDGWDGTGAKTVTTTFRPFDKLDLHDLLSWGFPAHDIEANDGTCFFEGLYRS